jgi:hypothetical protein
VTDALPEALATNLSNLEWFTAFCALLARDRKPTFRYACGLLGDPKEDPPRERRGSLFLAPFDSRFSYISINPDSPADSTDLPLEHIGLTGSSFALRVADLLDLFPQHRFKLNTYDGGYQIFFHPVPKVHEFTAISASTDLKKIPNPQELVVNNVSFHFGDVLVEFRDGFTMRR